jgi:hypothetical protein
MTPNAIYNIDWLRLSRLYFLQLMQKSVMRSFLKAILKPIEDQWVIFRALRDSANYRLSHNSQICYIEAVLNDAFDADARRIYIKNAEIKEPIWVYEPEDLKPVYLYEPSDDKPVFLREDSEFFGGGTDFTVWVPIEIKPDEANLTAFITKMGALVDYYKLYCKNYNIVFY